MTDRPLVLLSNDDGVLAPNLLALRDALAEHADVVICAPELNQSATSHSLSLHRPLRLREVGGGVFALDGTPADCVYVALHSGTRILPRRPDLAVSGMKPRAQPRHRRLLLGHRRRRARGGAAWTALGGGLGRQRRGSCRGRAPRGAARAAGARRVPPRARPADAAAQRQHPARRSLAGAGHRASARGSTPRTSIYRRDPRGREYLWIGGAGEVRHDLVPGSDTEAYDEGAASVTPLSLDLWAADRAGFAAEVAGAVKRRGRPARARLPPSGRPAHTGGMFNHDELPGEHALRYLRAHLRDVPDFPKPGILFKDITPLLADPRAFHITLDLFAERFIGEHVDVVVGVESRGFIFGGAWPRASTRASSPCASRASSRTRPIAWPTPSNTARPSCTCTSTRSGRAPRC